MCFCDSGAFSSFLTGEPMDWADVLQRYDSLALMTETPGNLYVVAPDKVGDQGETLRLLAACCLLYTSDAADERSSVDLGGRRTIKNKNKKKKIYRHLNKKSNNYMT
mgnify:CR=1 FL=1